MYEEYWGLSGSPFRNEADDQWFCESPGHEEALARLLYLVEQRRRCGLIGGAAGTGKSLLLRILVSQLNRSQRQSALINAAGLDRHELLAELCDGLKLPMDVSCSPFIRWRRLKDHLSGTALAHMQTVLLFDQFERAEDDCCRLVEQLLHIDVGGTLTVVVAARHEAAALTQLADVADLTIDVLPMDRPQTSAYIAEMLSQAGCDRELFEPDALEAIFQHSRGVPRAINRLCDLSLLAAMGDQLRSVDAANVVRATQELQAGSSSVRNVRLRA